MSYRWAKFENAMKEMYEERILGGGNPYKDLQYQQKQAKTLLFCQAKWLSNTKQSLGICVSKLQKQKVLGLIIASR